MGDDTDGDGLTDCLEERVYGTSPTSVDTDGDGCDDLVEVRSLDGNAWANVMDMCEIVKSWNCRPESEGGCPGSATEGWDPNKDLDANRWLNVMDMYEIVKSFNAQCECPDGVCLEP